VEASFDKPGRFLESCPPEQAAVASTVRLRLTDGGIGIFVPPR